MSAIQNDPIVSILGGYEWSTMKQYYNTVFDGNDNSLDMANVQSNMIYSWSDTFMALIEGKTSEKIEQYKALVNDAKNLFDDSDHDWEHVEISIALSRMAQSEKYRRLEIELNDALNNVFCCRIDADDKEQAKLIKRIWKKMKALKPDELWC